MADHVRGERSSRLPNPMNGADVHPDIAHITNRQEREEAILRILNSIGFNWPVFCAIAFGFLASSYSLFATNIISPALLYVYTPNGRFTSRDIQEVLDLTTLSSTLVGMIFFGHLADRGGRKRLYGWELIILIFATLGLVLSSPGYTNSSTDPSTSSMDIYASIVFFRCVIGFGIGAEYPVSAIIAAEFASTETRAVMMASIFLMQSLGRVLAVGIGLGSLEQILKDKDLRLDQTTGEANDATVKIAVDMVWRIVIGMGGVIALVAVGLRFIIPESPRYYSGIQKDLNKAARAVQRVGGKAEDVRSELSVSSGAAHHARRTEEPTPWFRSAIKYLRSGGWRRLAAMSAIWLLLDVCFYGTSLDSPATLNALWLPSTRQKTNEDWNQDPGWPTATIQEILEENAIRSLLLSSITSLAGSVLAIPVVYYANRNRLLIGTSLALTLLFIATGISVLKTYGQPNHQVSMVFFALAQFMFNLGPNTLTFILPAEIFPTVFRGTFYGISAAFGKLGAIIIRAIVAKYGNGKQALAAYLFVFAAFMLLLALIALIPDFLPEVQHNASKMKEASAETSIEEGDEHSSEHEARSCVCRLPPTRWRNKALEDIARYPLPEDELALQESVRIQEMTPAARSLFLSEGTKAETTPSVSNIPMSNGGGAAGQLEDGTQTFELDLTKRFYPPSSN